MWLPNSCTDTKAECRADPNADFLSKRVSNQDAYDGTFNVAKYEPKHRPQTGYMLDGCANLAPVARSDV